jgi:hypothetical protein
MYTFCEYTLREYTFHEYTLREYMFCKCTPKIAFISTFFILANIFIIMEVDQYMILMINNLYENKKVPSGPGPELIKQYCQLEEIDENCSRNVRHLKGQLRK